LRAKIKIRYLACLVFIYLWATTRYKKYTNSGSRQYIIKPNVTKVFWYITTAMDPCWIERQEFFQCFLLFHCGKLSTINDWQLSVSSDECYASFLQFIAFIYFIYIYLFFLPEQK